MNLEVDYEYKRIFLDNYNIKEVLYFSNGGGVYLVEYNKWGNVVLKEGCLYILIGFDNIDVFERVENEGKVLKKFMKVNYLVKIYDFFLVWEYKFIVEEYIEGDFLLIWMVNKYLFLLEFNNENYVKFLINILN